MCQHLLRFTAQQKAADSPAPMGRHEDQIAIALFGGFNDCLVRIITDQCFFLAVHSSFLTEVFDKTKGLLRLPFRELIETVRRKGTHADSLSGVVRHMKLRFSVEDDNLAPYILGKCNCAACGFL